MYLPTLCRYRTLTSNQPRVTPTLFLHPPHPPRRTLLHGSLRLDKTFDSFGGNLHNPPLLPPIFFLSSPTDTSRVDRSTLSYRSPSEYTYSPPLTFPLRETTTGSTSWFFTGRRGKGGRVYCFIFWTFSGASIFDDYTSCPGHAPMWRTDKITFAAFLSGISFTIPCITVIDTLIFSVDG